MGHAERGPAPRVMKLVGIAGSSALARSNSPAHAPAPAIAGRCPMIRRSCSWTSPWGARRHDPRRPQHRAGADLHRTAKSIRPRHPFHHRGGVPRRPGSCCCRRARRIDRIVDVPFHAADAGTSGDHRNPGDVLALRAAGRRFHDGRHPADPAEAALGEAWFLASREARIPWITRRSLTRLIVLIWHAYVRMSGISPSSCRGQGGLRRLARPSRQPPRLVLTPA